MVKLVRYTPRRLANDLWRDMAHAATYNSDTVRPVLRPAMDVIERENELEIRLNLPGIAADDVTVEVEDYVLTISGEINHAVDEENERYTYRERSYGAFKRSVRLSDTVDVDNINATYRDGVLSLSLPKQIAVKQA